MNFKLIIDDKEHYFNTGSYYREYVNALELIIEIARGKQAEYRASMIAQRHLLAKEMGEHLSQEEIAKI